MPHIFISYAKKDTRSLAIQLADALNAIEGLTAWVDRSLRAGKSWELEIQAQIDRCDVMVVLYSPDINRHKHGQDESYVLTEISYAKYTVRKPIIPVMVQRTEPPIALTAAHYIDFTLDGLTLADLVQALTDELGIVNTLKTITSFSVEDETQSVEVIPISDDVSNVSSEIASWLDSLDLSQNVDDVLILPLTGSSIPPIVDSILSSPLEWIEITGGVFTMGNENQRNNPLSKITLPTFWMAKYPVTNAQYAKFIEADGYRNQGWWTKEGWQVCKENKWEQPRRWEDANFNGAEQPVNAISWYEAIAFTNWLKESTGENVTLPTEAQWEKAARGIYGNVYPWGDSFDSSRCNTRESGIGTTTPVSQYEGKGNSPYDIVDMAGNVFEWCLDEYSRPNIEPAKVNMRSMGWRVLRGGSFYNNLSCATVSYRSFNLPNLAYSRFGFRLVMNTP